MSALRLALANQTATWFAFSYCLCLALETVGLTSGSCPLPLQIIKTLWYSLRPIAAPTTGHSEAHWSPKDCPLQNTPGSNAVPASVFIRKTRAGHDPARQMLLSVKNERHDSRNEKLIFAFASADRYGTQE
jgi:hypothetical protein